MIKLYYESDNNSPFWRLHKQSIASINILINRLSIRNHLLYDLLIHPDPSLETIEKIAQLLPTFDTGMQEWNLVQSLLNILILKIVLCEVAKSYWSDHLVIYKSLDYWYNVTQKPIISRIVQPWIIIPNKAFNDNLQEINNSNLSDIGIMTKILSKTRSSNTQYQFLEIIKTVKKEIVSWNLSSSGLNKLVLEIKKLKREHSTYVQPPFWHRFGIPITIGTVVTCFSLSKIFQYINRSNILHEIYKIPLNIRSFVREHLFFPIHKIWNNVILRQNDEIVSIDDLNESREVMTKLLTQYYDKYGILTEKEKIKAIKIFDTISIKEDYEKQADNVVWSVLFGNMDLITLIQIEELKIKLISALIKIDQLVETNRVNFEIAAIIPLVGILYLGRNVVSFTYVYFITNDTPSEWLDTMKVTLRDLDRMLTQHHDSPMTNEMVGKLITNVDQLNRSFLSRNDLFSMEDQERWIEDMDDILNLNSKAVQRYRILDRINHLFLK